MGAAPMRLSPTTPAAPRKVRRVEENGTWISLRLSGRDHVMRVEDVLLGRAAVEVLVSLRRLVQRNDGGVHRLGYLYFVMENALHELAVVPHDGALARGEEMRFGPTQPDADTEIAGFRGFVHTARIIGDVQAGNTDGAAGTGNCHGGVQHRSRTFHRVILALAVRLESDAIHGGIHFRNADDLLYLLPQRSILA